MSSQKNNDLITKMCEVLLFDFGKVTKDDIIKNGAIAFHTNVEKEKPQKTYRLLRLNDKKNKSVKRSAKQAFDEKNEQKEKKMSEGEILFLQKQDEIVREPLTKKMKLQ